MNTILNKGIYCLIIKLVQQREIRIGNLGIFQFPAGFYTYAGSAQINMKRRIERHLRKRKKLRWHIDYLLSYGNVTCVHTYRGVKYMECVLNHKIGRIANSIVPVKNFGSSDCSCVSHLHFFYDNPDPKISQFPMKTG
ncbi:MAG: GIY-YIG nuclease family protein [Candidatus Brocadiaceae bacterium]|nr:GIY-YIG nuclease family protein [Candidatus Brocadiaceae bacterium]